jgi:hypothetical protein
MIHSESQSGRGKLWMVALLALVPGMVLLPALVAQAASPKAAFISSIVTKGSTAKPLVIVKGSGFGATAPVANPTTHPNGQSACPAFPVTPAKYIKHDGHDFGTDMLWLENSTPNESTAGWRAGDYVPGSEIDCIGLRIVKWSRTEVEFNLGTAYDHPTLEDGNQYQLNQGDSIEIDVRGVESDGTVCFGCK